MGPARLLLLLGTGVLMAAHPHPATAQWTVGAEVGANRFWGGSEETGPEHRSFRPYRPTTVGLVLVRRAGRAGAGLRLQYYSAGLALEGKEGLVAAKGIFEVYGVDAHLIYRLARLLASELVIEAGPLLEVWSVSGEDSQTRLGGQAGMSLKIPLGRSLVGSLSVGAGLIASPFAEGQLDQGFERRALWRRRLAGGLELRL